MSFTDRVVLWLHVAFALFTIGPLVVVTMSTPRYVRARNLPVLRYLARTTRLYTVISLGVLILGIVLAQLRHDFSHPWLSASITLFVVALVLLVLVVRDQHRAIVALDSAAKAEVAAGARASRAAAARTARGQLAGGGEAPPARDPAHAAAREETAAQPATEAQAAAPRTAGAQVAGSESAATANAGAQAAQPQTAQAEAAQADTAQAAPAAAEIPQLASVERGRIASLSGLASLIWLVILVLMIWQP